MKRFWKCSLTVIGVIAAVGLTCIILGGLFGGCGPAGEILRHKTVGWPESMHAGLPSCEDREIATADEVKSIHMKATRSVVVITAADEDFYGISAEDMDVLGYRMDGDCLIVEAEGKEHEDGSLTLYIPVHAVPDDVEIEIGGGILTVDGLTAGTFSLEAGAGSFSVSSLRADNALLQVGAGTMEITDGDVTGLVIEAGMGKFFWQGRIRGDVEAECGMGAVTLEVMGSAEDFNYQAEAPLGDVMIEGVDASQWFYDGLRDNGADRNMDLACAMGTVTVRFYENGGNGNGK